MSLSRPMSMRMAAAAGSLALAISAFSAPAAFAQEDSPEATIDSLVAAIEAKDFEALPSFFCADFAGEMGGLDLASLTEGLPPGLDLDTLLDAFILDVELDSVDVLSETDTEAVVSMVGSMSMDINADAIGPMIEAMAAAFGQELSEDQLADAQEELAGQFEAEATDISAEITLVAGEDGEWLVCSDITGGGSNASSGSAASPTDTSEPTTNLTHGELPGEGTFLVGVDMTPGTYRSGGPADGRTFCTWQRLSGLSGELDDVIAIENEQGQALVTVGAADMAFSSSGCQPWARVG